MLKEIFEKIANEMENHLLQKGISSKVAIGVPLKETGKNMVFLEMLDYGIDPFLKNRMPSLDDESSTMPNYSHLLSFFVLPASAAYEDRLQLVETIVEFFEVKPFFQLTIHKEEFELSISMKPVPTADYQQFWIAQQKPPQPVVFYQARVSAI